jgi:hypothetical protein
LSPASDVGDIEGIPAGSDDLSFGWAGEAISPEDGSAPR